MAITKTWKDLYELDLKDYTAENPQQKVNGKPLVYLPWNMCLKVLYDQGAENVEFIPLYTESQHSVFTFPHGAMIEKDGGSKRAFDPYCPEVHVAVVVDDKRGEFSYPLINGLEVITMGKINQQLVNSARQRAFVKGVAILTGLGLKLWEKEEQAIGHDDLSSHKIFSIKRRVQETVTGLIQRGKTQKDILDGLGMNQKQYDQYMKSFDALAAFEKKLNTL